MGGVRRGYHKGRSEEEVDLRRWDEFALNLEKKKERLIMKYEQVLQNGILKICQSLIRLRTLKVQNKWQSGERKRCNRWNF